MWFELWPAAQAVIVGANGVEALVDVLRREDAVARMSSIGALRSALLFPSRPFDHS